MKSIIIDDEEMARAIIEKLSSNNKNLNLIASFSNAIEAIKYLNQHEIQAPLDCAYDYFHDTPNANISLRNCNYW